MSQMLSDIYNRLRPLSDATDMYATLMLGTKPGMSRAEHATSIILLTFVRALEQNMEGNEAPLAALCQAIVDAIAPPADVSAPSADPQPRPQ